MYEKTLFDQISKVVADPVDVEPRTEDASFVLHAPLELCTRYFLMPLVKESHRDRAIFQMQNIETKYSKFEKSMKTIPKMPVHADTNFGIWSTSTLFAGHATILAALVKRLGETNEFITRILENMNAEILTNHESRFAWVSLEDQSSTLETEHPIDLKNIASWFINEMANVESAQGDSDSIAEIVKAAEKAGLIEPLVLAWLKTDIDPFDILHHVYPIILRIAAISMLLEPNVHSKYGWTHCLTIPHSHWVLADNPETQKMLLCSSITYVGSFRSVLGQRTISADDFIQYFDENEEAVFTAHYEEFVDIISRACVLEDAHLVKYVYSCFDIAKRDPHYTKLYIAAALALLKRWEV